MTKEQLTNELEKYKKYYEEEKEYREKLEIERESIENYRVLNLDLQVEINFLKQKVKDLEKDNEILINQNKTYETTFNILKGSDNE